MSSNLQHYYDLQYLDYIYIVKEFTKPIYRNKFIINKFYLSKNSDNIKFSKDVWIMRPEFFCADHYGHPFFSPVILLMNNLKSIFEFKPEKFYNNYIIAPKKNSILEILNMVQFETY